MSVYSEELAAQFTSESGPGVINVWLGLKPDRVEYVQDTAATNPNYYRWYNAEKYGVADADSDNDDVFLLTGSTGVVTKTEGIKPYAGGETITDSNKALHRKADGTTPVAGEISKPGVTIAAAIQTASKHNVLTVYRAGGITGSV